MTTFTPSRPHALALAAALGLFCFACSSTTINNTGTDGGTGEAPSGGDPASPADAGSGTRSNGNGGTCCINSAFYLCSSKAAFDGCAGFDMDACMAACGPAEGECVSACFEKLASASHDPSGCTRDPSKDATCSSPRKPPASSCKGSGTSPFGAGCSLSSQCCSENCTGGTCQTNGYGAKCSLSSQCESNNCTDGSCQNTFTGSPCTLDSQCDSKNCTDGTCQF